MALNKRALVRLWLARRNYFNVAGLSFRPREDVSHQQNPPHSKMTTNGSWIVTFDRGHVMDDMGIQILTGELMIPGQHPRSWLPAAGAPLLPTSHHHLHPVFTTPPFSTPRYHLYHVSTNSQRYSLPSTYSPPPRMSQLASQISIPLKFRQRPGPCKNGVAEATRWIPRPAAKPSRAKCSLTVEFKLGVLAWA